MLKIIFNMKVLKRLYINDDVPQENGCGKDA